MTYLVVILVWSFITAIWVLGVTIVTQENMALYRLREIAEKKESLIYEPLILCVWCMPSLHSIVGFGFAVGLGLIPEIGWRTLLCLPLVIMLTSLITGSVWSACQILMNNAQSSEHREQLLHFDLKDRKKRHRERSILRSLKNNQNAERKNI